MSESQAQDRRQFLKKAATVAWAAPLILSVTPGRAGAQAISCAPAGTGCGVWDTELQACLPGLPPVVCCNDCVRGTGGQDMFCVCT